MSTSGTIDALWTEASERFREKTRKNLDFRPRKTLEQIKVEVERCTSSAASEDQNVAQRAKVVGFKVIYLIKLVGGVAAKGASMVFGSADLCFNALSVLMDIPVKVKDFHSLLRGLFEEIHTALTQFKIYQKIESISALDLELIENAHQVMISFVDICALSVNLQSGSKTKHFFRDVKWVLTGDDSGVKAELDNFRSRAARTGNIERTLTLQHVMQNEVLLQELGMDVSETKDILHNVNSRMETLIDDQVLRHSKDQRHRELRYICDQFNIAEVFQPLEQLRSSQSHFSVKGTGSWLWDMQQYRNWAHSASGSGRVLLLTGAAKTGKSFIVSAIHNQLQFSSTLHVSENSIAMIGFFTVPSPPSSMVHNTDHGFLRQAKTVITSIIYQFAEQSDHYRKSLIEKLEETGSIQVKDLQCNELWRQLGPKVCVGGSTYFVLLDGLEHLQDSDRDCILETFEDAIIDGNDAGSGAKVQVLLSATKACFDDLPWKELLQVEIEQHNQSDVMSFINHELDRLQILRDKSPEADTAANIIRETLPHQANGDYGRIKRTLGRISRIISQSGTLEDVKSAIDQAGQSPKETIKSDLQDLQNELSDREIKELNELLLWVCASPKLPKVEQLEAALYYKFGSRSLHSLRDKMKGKYSRVFWYTQLVAGTNVWGYRLREGVLEALKENAESAHAATDEPKINITLTVHQGDATSVRDFVWSLCQECVTDKSRFDALFVGRVQREQLFFDETEGAMYWTKQAFALLQSEPPEDMTCLLIFVVSFLPDVLEKLLSLSRSNKISEAQRKEIIRGVVAVLKDGSVIERLWARCEGNFLGWAPADSFWPWLCAPSAVDHLEAEDRKWLERIKDEPNPITALLIPVSTMTAKSWLRNRDLDAFSMYQWVAWLWDKIHQRSPPDGNYTTINQSRLEEHLNWARNVLSMTELDSVSHERVGVTCGLRHKDLAISSFQKAIAVDDSNWRCHVGFARCLEKVNKEESIKARLRALEILRSSFQVNESEKESLLWNIREVADIHFRRDDTDSARKLYMEAIKVKPDDPITCTGLIKTLSSKDDVHNIRKLIIPSNANGSLARYSTRLDSMLKHMVLPYANAIHMAHREAIYALFTLVRGTEMALLLETRIRKMVDSGETDANLRSKLCLYYGVGLLHCIFTDASDEEAALRVWQQGYSATDANPEVRLMSARCMADYHLDQSMTSNTPHHHVLKLREFAKQSYTKLPNYRSLRYPLAKYLVRSTQSEEARQLLRANVQDALDNLSNDIDWDDVFGLHRLAKTFVKLDDRANALTAWSIVGPKDLGYSLDIDGFKALDARGRRLLNVVRSQQPNANWGQLLNAMLEDEQLDQWISDPKERSKVKTTLQEELAKPGADFSKQLDRQEDRAGSEGFNWVCFGTCGTEWNYADEMFSCEICDAHFCPECLTKLKNGSLRCFTCSKDHEWLHVPPWDDMNFPNVVAGITWAGGEIKEGVRVGGRKIPVQEWLDDIRKEWNIDPTPKKARHATDKPKTELYDEWCYDE